MLSLNSVEKINQVLGTIATYPLLLSELHLLEAQQDENIENLSKVQIIYLCTDILFSRLKANPDLSYNPIIWEELIAKTDGIDPTEMAKIIQVQNKTGFIIGI